MPTVGTCYLVCLTDNPLQKLFICVVVCRSNANYIGLQQALVDGHGDPHVPLTMGNLLGIDPATGLPKLTDAPDVDNPTVQWVLAGDTIVNTPAWPDLTKKYGLVTKPGQVNP